MQRLIVLVSLGAAVLVVAYAIGFRPQSPAGGATAAPPRKWALHERANELERDASGEIIGLSLMFDACSDDDLAQLADYPQLKRLRIQECPRVCGAGFVHIAALPNLESLAILNTPIDDESLAHLSASAALAELSLQRTQVTGKTLNFLPADLTNLELGGRGFLASEFQSLRRFTKLRKLELHLLDLPLRNLPPFGEAKQLKELDLTGTPVDDAGLARLEGLGSLQVLQFDASQVSDAGISILGQMRELTALDLATSQMTDGGLAHLQHSTKLRTLWLGRGVSDAGLEQLKPLQDLQVLELRHTRIDGSGLAHLSSCQKLTELILPNKRFSPEGKRALENLKASLPDCYIAVAGGG